jgi:hypothetical protein
MRPKHPKPEKGAVPAGSGTGATNDAAASSADREGPPRVGVAGLDSARLDGAQSYPDGALSDAEKAYIDFLVEKAVEAWLKR